MARGGARPGAGRKSKAETLQLDKLLDECVSDDDIKELFRVLVENGKRGNINATMALLAYRYGKPKDRMELSGDEGRPIKQIIEVVYVDTVRTATIARGTDSDQTDGETL